MPTKRRFPQSTVFGLCCMVLLSCNPDEGCTDSDASNYNPEASVDDGSCQYDITGCTDSQALNFNPVATIDDGSCDYGTSPNFPSCSQANSGNYFGVEYPIIQIGNQCWFAANLRTTTFTNGDEIPTEPNLEDILLTEEPFSVGFGQDIVDVGCYDQYFQPFNPCVDENMALERFGRLYNWHAVSDSRGLCPTGWHVADTTDWTALKNHLNSEGLTGYANHVMATTGWVPDNNGASNQSNTTGLGVEASGYLETVDFSYTQFCCAGEYASHWTPLNDFEDPIDVEEGTSIRFYYNGSGISWEGLSKTTGAYVRCVEDGGTVLGCLDPNASNYNPNANIDDGSCEYDFSPSCMNSVVHDSYTYEIVAIGNQCWFTENLKTTIFSNGDEIPQGLNPTEWASIDEAACTVFGGNSGLGIGVNPGLTQDYTDIVGFDISDTISCLESYGRLYNWYAAVDERNLCPSGFHVPTAEEWETLRNVIDPTGSMVWPLFSDFGWYEMSNWGENVSQPNEFNSMPGGYLGVTENIDGTEVLPDYYYGIGESTSWWSSTESGFDPNLALGNGVSYEGFYTEGEGKKNMGQSIRCIQD